MAKTSHKLWCCSSAQKTVAPRDTGSLVSFKNKSFQVRQCALPLYECKPHKERKSHYDILLTLGGTSLSLQSAREYSPDVEKKQHKTSAIYCAFSTGIASAELHVLCWM